MSIRTSGQPVCLTLWFCYNCLHIYNVLCVPKTGDLDLQSLFGKGLWQDFFFLSLQYFNVLLMYLRKLELRIPPLLRIQIPCNLLPQLKLTPHFTRHLECRFLCNSIKDQFLLKCHAGKKIISLSSTPKLQAAPSCAKVHGVTSQINAFSICTAPIT
jgi:hypothetical protein